MQPTNTVQTLEPFLAEHPFFKDWAKEYQHLLTECASNVRVDAGQFLFREGDTADRLYLIRHGKIALQVATHNHGPITIQTLREGDVLGWSWLVPPYRWHFDAQALELTRAIALDGQCLQRKCQQDPKLGYELMKRVAELLTQRLQALNLQLVQAYDDHLA
jgi:CRP/FNR family transcriptional regulator, cyclic AMP receptor protein